MDCGSIELVDSLFLNMPFRVSAKPAVGAHEHLAGFLVALELPLEEFDRNLAKLAAIRLVVSSAVADAVFPCAECRHFADALEVIVAVRKGDVG